MSPKLGDKSKYFLELKEITTNSDFKKLKDTTHITKSQINFPFAGSPECQWPVHPTLLKVKCSSGESTWKEMVVSADCC